MVEETRIVTRFLREHPDDSWTIDAALANGAYRALRKALGMTPDQIVEEVTASGLRGRGGAGFGTGQKWSFLPKGVFPRYLAVNGDEGEPSTFKDHMLVERDPHQLVEGVVISSYAIQCHTAFIYLRGEFALGAERLGRAISDAYGRGFLGRNILGSGFDLDVVLHRGAGCYIAGDETGLLSSLEGERAMPRIKPPFPAVQGVYAAPTIVNNVETMSTVPHIVDRGGAWYASMGVNRSTGTRIFSVSGNVARPGNYEVELGITFRDLIYGLAGGIATSTSRSTWTTCRASSRRCSDRAPSWCSTRRSTPCSSRGGSRSSSRTSRAGSARRAAKGPAGWRRSSIACRTGTGGPTISTCCSGSATTSHRDCPGRRV
jgi:NADH-quinone oxidoreductase subunit F